MRKGFVLVLVLCLACEGADALLQLQQTWGMDDFVRTARQTKQSIATVQNIIKPCLLDWHVRPPGLSRIFTYYSLFVEKSGNYQILCFNVLLPITCRRLLTAMADFNAMCNSCLELVFPSSFCRLLKIISNVQDVLRLVNKRVSQAKHFLELFIFMLEFMHALRQPRGRA